MRTGAREGLAVATMTALEMLAAAWHEPDVPADSFTVKDAAKIAGISPQAALKRLEKGVEDGLWRTAVRKKTRYFWPAEVDDAATVPRPISRARDLRIADVGSSGDAA